MEPKERLLAAITGGEADRLPYAPCLAYFWQTVPKTVRDQGEVAFLQGIGADPLLRGSHSLYKMSGKKCKVTETIRGNEKLTEYFTPVGNLKSKHVYTPGGDTWFLTEYPVSTKEDFKILSYIYNDMIIEPDYGQFLSDYHNLGTQGLYVPIIGTEQKTSFEGLIEYRAGPENLAYSIADFPEVVDECLEAMRRKAAETVKISVNSPAEAFIFWEDSSTTVVSPAYFKRYTAPEIEMWAKMIHREGKYLIHHACGHLRGLITDMSKTGIDVIESVSPPPTGNIEIWKVKQMLEEAAVENGKSVSLIGGIEPTVLLNSTLEELTAYVDTLLDKMGNNRSWVCT